MSNQQPQYEVNLDRTANVPISEGVHTLQIKSFEEAEGPAAPYWKFIVVCLDPGEEGKETIMIQSLADTVRWRLELFLDAMSAPKTGTVTADKFVGRKFRGHVTWEKYEGRDQARIGEMFPYSNSPAGSPASPSANPAVKKVTTAPKATTAVVKKTSALPKDAVSEDNM